MASLPVKPNAANIVLVCNWMAEKISDEHAIIATPATFIERAVKYAKDLGMHDSHNGIMAIPDRRDQAQATIAMAANRWATRVTAHPEYARVTHPDQSMSPRRSTSAIQPEDRAQQ